LEKILKIIKNAKISLVMYDIAQFYFFITKCSVCCRYEKTLSVTCMHLLGVSLRVPYWMCWTDFNIPKPEALTKVVMMTMTLFARIFWKK